ncbi:MAG: anhydro-N-acetylmuramic acid kinase, partial [Proteobacteria bacterium]|nr:anhydro-N-acetylmuramic acid kinase [Pseudomonadota bacterium]
MTNSKPEIYIGLMSGTSMDGIDAALVDFSSTQPELLDTYSHPWPDAVQQELIEARDLADEELSSLSAEDTPTPCLDVHCAEVFAEACMKLIGSTAYQAEDIIAIGNHGQTIRHRPDIENPFSLQLGKAQALAEKTGIDVISNFRTADIQAGGQGAPLAPAFHQAVFRTDELSRVIVNIGGIANITYLPADEEQAVTGFDCGPGNTLMDAWMSQQRQQSFDRDGALAASGKTNAVLLAHLLMDDYFQLAPPKSTGFEYFNLSWLSEIKQGAGATNPSITNISDADMQSTLCDLTAASIIRAINQHAPDCAEIYICGGGIHNAELMRRLQAMTKIPVATTEKLGVHPDWVEAMAFAWLAYRHKHQLP